MEKTNKLTSKKLIMILVAVFAVCVVALGILAFARNYVNEIATEKKYEYYNPDETKAETDEGFKIDGVLDEEIYQKCTWLYARNAKGDASVDLAMTSYYGEKGMYYIYDVTESSTIYVNPDRSNYCNSSIEMYLAPDEASNLRYNNTYEMHLLPTGDIGVYRSSGSGGFTRGEAQDEFMPCLGATTKGGKVNDPDCHGYYLELFIPWEYYESQGSDLEEVKSNYMYINPAHITSYNESGTDLNGDRFWYAFATQLGGDGWSDVTKYFKFDGQGLVGSVPITYEKEEHCTITGSKTIIPGMKAYVTITPEEGYALSSILVNGEEWIKKVSYNEDGSVTLALKSKGEPITISVSAEKITAGNKTLRGIVYPHKLGGDNLEGVEISYKGPNGEKPITLDANGTFELKDLKQGYYTITVSKKGYQNLVRGISLKRDVDTELWLEYDLLAKESGTCWDIEEQNDGILNSIGGNGILLTKDSYNKFSVEGNFRFDESIKELAEHDFYEQQRIGLRIKFSNGKYWHVDVLQQEGEYLVQYAELTGKDSIYSWTKIHTMTAAEAAKYKSADGINLKVVRDGQYANVYLGNKFIAAEDFGADYKNLTAQVGFESYAACDGISTVKFDIKTNNVKVQKTPYFSRSGGWDISKQFQGLVTLPNGGHNAKLKFSQKYTDMDLTLTVRDYANGIDDTTTDSPRTDVRFIFEDGKELTFGVLQRKNNGDVIIQSMADSKNTITGWTTQYTFTDDEEAQFRGDGVKLRIVRIGTEFALYIGDKMVKVCDFEGKISADTKADIYLRHWGDEGVDVEIPFSMKTDLNKVTITDVGSQNGKVVGQKKTYLVGDTVVLIGESEAYYCNAMNVDGQAVIMNDDATYRFVATKNSYNVQGNFVRKTFADNYSWNLLSQNEGLITLPGGGDNFTLKFYEKYVDMDLTLTVKDHPKGEDNTATDSPRTDVKFIFEDGKELTFGVLQRKDNGECIIQSMQDSKNTITGWTTQYKFTDEEKAQFKSEDGIKFRIVRMGTEFTLYIEDRIVKVCNYADKIKADTKAELYIRHWGDEGVDIDMPFHMTANLNKVTITDAGSKNGEVVAQKTYLVGDQVVLNGKGDEGYYCYGMKVDGQEVTLNANGTYTFTAEKATYTVEGLFDKKVFADNSSWNLLKQNEGLITLPGGGDNFGLKFYDKYVDMDLTLTVKNDPTIADSATDDTPRTDVKFVFENEKELTFGVLQRKNNGNVEIQSMADSNKTITGWTTQYTFTPEEKAQFQSEDGIKFRIVRIGTEFTLYINGNMVKVCDFEGKIEKDVKATVHLRHWGDKGVDIDIPFSVKTTFDKVTIENVDNQYGKAVGQKKTYILGDKVVLKGKGNEGYYCIGMKVDGEDVSLGTDGTYTFTAEKTTYTVETEFARSIFVDGSSWDISKQHEGTVTQYGGGYQTVDFYDSYEDMDLTLTVKDSPVTSQHATRRVGVLFEFVNGEKVCFSILNNNWQGGEYKEYILQTSGQGASDLINTGGNTRLHKMTDDEIAAFTSEEGIDFRIVKNGAKFYLYLNGNQIASEKSLDFADAIGTGVNAKVTLAHWGGAGHDLTIPFSVSNKVKPVTINGLTEGNGEVIANQAAYFEGDTVTLTVTPDEGYDCTGMKVNDKEVTVNEDGTYSFKATKATYTVEAIYQRKIFVDGSGWDVSEQYEGKVTLPNGGHNYNLKFYDKYETINLMLKVKDDMRSGTEKRRTDVLFAFDNGKQVSFSVLDNVWGGASHFIIQSMPNINNPLTGSGWVTQWNMTEEEIAAYQSENGIEFRIIREGTKFYLYLDGNMRKELDFAGSIETTTKATVSIRHFGATGTDVVVPFDVCNKIKQVKLSGLEAGKGVVTADKTSYVVGERITLTVTPNEGYNCTGVKVNGKSLTVNQDGTYTFISKKQNCEVEATYKRKIFVDGSGWDVSKQYEGIVTLPNGGHNYNLKFYDKYEDIDLTITVKDDMRSEISEKRRTDVLFAFDNGKQVSFSVLNNAWDGNDHFMIQSMPNISNPLTGTGWVTQWNMTKDEGDTYRSENGIPFQIKREGTKFYLYLNGNLRKELDFSGQINATTKATVSIRHFGATGVDVNIPFSIK